MAGDSALNHAINVIIHLTVQDDDLNSIELNEISNKLKTPIAIIPCGAINMIAHSIYGSIDYISPLMFLLYGKTIKIDLSTVYTGKDKLHTFGFNSSVGFGTTIGRYLLRYARFGVNKVQTSIARGAAKQNHRLINVEINYLVNDDPENNPKNEEICVKGFI
jgi:diacylglycerol kinase family enzyme